MEEKKEIIRGRIGKEIRLAYTPKHQTPICRFEVATEIEVEGVGVTNWRKVVLVGKLAQNFKVRAKKGMKVFIEGMECLVSFINEEGRQIEYLEFRGETAAIEVI